MRRLRRVACLLLLACACAAPPAPSPVPAQPPAPAHSNEYSTLADAIETHLEKGVLDAWYPRLIDKRFGGFGPHVKADFSFEDKNNKFLVFQARMTWVAAEVVRRYPARREKFAPYVEHGISFLRSVMWDKAQGGFFWDVEPNGTPRTTEKHAYGVAFAIYATAAAARATGDRGALELSMRAFSWLDEHGHDATNGGYDEAFTREGKPILEAQGTRTTDDIGTVYGRRSMNTHIHLLEAFTELYLASHDAVVRQRVQELHALVRDKIAAPDGYLYVYLTPKWEPIAADDSYGHDIEAAFLLLETATALGIAEDTATLRVARRLVDRALERGWDDARGGFYDAGPPAGRANKLEKVWWVQAEGLNSLLVMHELYGESSDQYWKTFVRQWSFIDAFVADKRYGDWYSGVTPEGKNAHPDWGKGGEWKDPYHQSRALMRTAEGLRRLARPHAVD
jgi:mannobiose 2-epimerase